MAFPLRRGGSGTLFLVLCVLRGLFFSRSICSVSKVPALVSVAALVPRCFCPSVWLVRATTSLTTGSGLSATGSRLVFLPCAFLLLVAVGRLGLTRFASRWVPGLVFLPSALVAHDGRCWFLGYGCTMCMLRIFCTGGRARRCSVLLLAEEALLVSSLARLCCCSPRC